MARATLSDEAAGRLKPAKKLVKAHRFAERSNGPTPANVLGTSTPAGILEHDPDVVKGARSGEGSQEPGDPLAPVGAAGGRDAAFLGLPITTMVLIARIELHPANPRQDYPEDEIAALAEDIRINGLISPILVRPHPTKKDREQLVCGHRRLLAVKKLKQTSIAANQLRLSDVETLRILASENSQRKDLNPWEEAVMLETLTLPASRGGAGMTDAQAAALYGHTETWATNKRRLLALPEPWRSRLVSREIDETKARALLPYVEAPRVMAAIDEEWERGYDYPLKGMARETFVEHVERIVRDATVKLKDATKQSWYEKPNYRGKPLGHHPYYVDFEAHREALEIVKLPIRGWGDKAKTSIEERVTNLAALHRLQVAAIRKREKTKVATEDKADAEHRAKAKAEKKTLTPAQLKAKAAEAQRVLGERIKKWKLAFKRFLAADFLRSATDNEPRNFVVDRVMTFVASGGGSHFEEAVEHVILGKKKSRLDIWQQILALPLHDHRRAMAAAVAEWLWPTDADAYECVSTFDVPLEVCDWLWSQCGNMADAWTESQTDQPAGAGLLFHKFLDLHNSEQLRTLAAEWDIFIADNAKRSTAIEIIQAKVNERRLKLPKCLGEKGSGVRGQGSGKKRANRKGAKARS